jgi:choline dehydrogenase-like flavoprotein
MMNDDRHVVVVGSGHSGASAALTLLEQGIPVTMLESGFERPQGGLLVRMMGMNIYRRKPKIEEHHQAGPDGTEVVSHESFVVGGLSHNWAGAVPRFAAGDFDEGARLHEKYRWPISYEALAPYYQRIERLAGVVGQPKDVPQLPAPVVKRAVWLPKDWQNIAAHAEQFGNGLTMFPRADVKSWSVIRSGASFNTAVRVLPLLQRFPHFRLVTGAHVHRLEWNGAKRQVDGVIYVDRVTGSEQRVRCAAVVLGAGALSSTKLLYASANSDFSGGLGNTEGVLGKYLHDHPMDWVEFVVDKPLSRIERNAYMTRPRYEDSKPLMGYAASIGNVSGKDRLLSIARVKGTGFGAQVYGTMIPTESQRVEFQPDLKDEFGLPGLDIHLTYSDEEIENIVAARERLMAILDSAGHHGTVTYSNPEYVPGVSIHFGGSIRMHESPQYGMLNAWNRLHAVNNVVVADMSCFTTSPEKNPALTTMALATRAAERLAQDLKSSALSDSGKKLHALPATG